MPIYNSVGGITGLTIESDPSALKMANNLSDLPNLTTARTNLQLSTYFAALSHNHNGTYAPVSHTHPVSDVTGWGSVSGASNGYVLSWNGSALVWVAQSGGGSGDRYLTTSTTSLAINNTNKTLTVGTGLSYTPTQSVTISFDVSNHMHGEVLTYDSGTGVMTVDVNGHTGSGTYAVWTVNVGGVVGAAYLPLTGGTMSGAVYVPQINNILNTDLVIDSYNDTGAGTHYLHKFTPNDGKFVLAPNGGGLTFPDGSVQSTAFNGIPAKSVNSYASSYTLSSVDANNIVNHTSSVTMTIPQDSTYNFAIGTIITVVDSNLSGMPTLLFAQEDTMGGVPTIVGGFSSSLRVVELVKVSANTWVHN
jgi:hypothetical protein